MRAGTPKEQCLLAILLLSPNQPVTVEEISDRVWDARPPFGSRKTIERYVTSLRGRLRRLFGDRVQIIGKQGTYQLTVDPETIDVCRFERLRRDASDAAHQDNLERAIELYREAESLFGGEPLSGLPSAWARRKGRDLTEKLSLVRRERIELELRLGRYSEVLDELAGLMEQPPDDQTLVRHLMTALAATGRRTDALAVFRRFRVHLIETYGMEPDWELQELHQRLLSADEDLAGHRRRERHGPRWLPPDIPHFVGREAELEQIGIVPADRLGGGVVVIEGMPGVGKTALAVHAAHRLATSYPDAQLYLDLKAHDRTSPPLNPRVALAQLLAMLGDTQARPSLPFDELFARWRAQMAGLRALLVLDDAADLEQVRPLLPANPERWAGLVIVTTRNRVEPHGVRRIPLGTLSVHEVAEMWDRLTGKQLDPVAYRRLWSFCTGLPLAIHGLARSGGLCANESRQQIPEVHEAVERSYRRLAPEQQRAFRRLGLFPGDDLTVDVARLVIDAPPEAARAQIDALVRGYLLDWADAGDTTRFRLHPLVRAVAAELARKNETERDIRALDKRVLRHYVRATEAVDHALFPHRWRMISLSNSERHDRPSPAAALAWLDAEWRTILSLAKHAAEHEWQAECADLMHLVAEYLDLRGHHAEAAEGHARAVRACRDIGDQLGRARALLDLAFARFRIADYLRSAACVEEARPIFRAYDMPQAIAKCVELYGLACWMRDRRQESLALWDEAEDLYRKVGDRKGLADILRHKAMARWSIGRYVDADRLSDEALRVYREIGDRIGEMKTLNDKGHMAQRAARHRHADRLLRDAAVIWRELTGEESHAILDHNQGDLHRYKGRYETALEYYERALDAYRSTENRRYEADVLNGMGESYLGLGRIADALDHFHRARDLAARIGCPSEKARALAGIADVDRELGRPEEAVERYAEALEIVRIIGDPLQKAALLDRYAHVLVDCDRQEDACVRWRQARNLYEDIGMHEFAAEIELKRSILGGRAFDDE